MAKLADSHYVMSGGNLMAASITDKCTPYASNSQTLQREDQQNKGTIGGLLHVRNDASYCHF